MAKQLKNLSVREVSGVDAAANKRKFLLAKAAGAPTKTEGGQNFPALAYAYAPDPKEPSTWKLRLVESPGAQPTAAQVGRAIAAMGKGFRGQKVSIPSADLPKVKAKILTAWRKTHPGETDYPPILKGAPTMAKNNAVGLMLAKALRPIKKGLPANVQALLDQLNTPEGDETEAPDLVDYVEDQESDEQLDDLCCALSDALDDVLDSETIEDKRTAVTALLEQFQEALGAGGLLKAAGILKAGRKISSSNLATLQQIDTLLTALIVQAGGDPSEADEADGVTPDADGSDAPNDAPDGEDDDDSDPGDVQQARKAAKGKRAAKKAEREKARKEKPMAKSAEFTAIEKRLAESEAAVKKERDIRLNAEFLQKARDIGPVPGMTFEKAATMLKSLSETNPTMAKEMEQQFRASAEVARKSALFGEIGKSSQGGAPDAATQMVAKAQEIAKRDSIGFADAMTKASKEDPALFAEYVNNQRKGA